MRLRVRHATGISMINIAPNSSMVDLQKEIATAIGVPSYRAVQVAGGYPPKPLTDHSDLKTAGIRDGDALIVSIVEPPPTPKDTKGIQTENGFLMFRGMDDDNSCLFRAIGYVLERDISKAPELRRVIGKAILDDPITYDDVTLGKPREKYIEWIQKDGSWGGAIELSIFSKYFSVEIDSIDVQTGRVDRFGEGSYPERVFILYSGIHYDALAMSPTIDSPLDFDQTRFPIGDESAFKAAQAVATALRQGHQYTDIANFTLRCQDCKKGLVGEKDAQMHASSTGHTHFAEYE
ncbi:hypothetical protein CLU79DRAFT_732094 [Phycomyces nitens]|nr:hypothetical protein CLU79DRAFT_732094 [Phycomyces nitens]